MPYVGWVEVTFRLATDAEEFYVPMLVMKGSQQSRPIIGFNVIERIVINSQEKQTEKEEEDKLIKTVKMATAMAFINAVSVERTSQYLVRTACQKMSIPGHSAVQVKCRINAKPFKEHSTPVFEPDSNPQWPEGLLFCDTPVQVGKGTQQNIILSVQNPTDNCIILTGKIAVGTAQLAMSVYPLRDVKETHSVVDVNNIQAQHVRDQDADLEPWGVPIDLSHLSEYQKQVVREMLKEESDSFSRSDNDIGCVKNASVGN